MKHYHRNALVTLACLLFSVSVITAKAEETGSPWPPGVPHPPGLAWPEGKPWPWYVPKKDRTNYHFWIGDTGPSGPVFTGPHQYPFICSTYESGLGQPLVDNQDGIGNAVFPQTGGTPDIYADPIGYSVNCSIESRVDYYYLSRVNNRFKPFNPATDHENSPADMAQTTTTDDKTVNFIVRLERGTINRFIYSIAMLAPYAESLNSPEDLNNSAWNGKLVYKFQGGVGIGHWQGSPSLSNSQMMHLASLERGYAVAYSTGNKMGVHYNLRLAEETAVMVKNHFKAVYAKPDYTVGIGASGGGIQQYVLGQNHPGLIDAGIPQYSYSDMITQSIYVGDCELMERYFDMEYYFNPASRWADWLQRSLLEGMNASNTADKDPWNISPFAPRPGSSECINGWRGLSPFIFNPDWVDPGYFQALETYRYPQAVIDEVKWTHWNDLGNIYPRDENGFAPNSWDNVGVQYGLESLVAGDLSVQEFQQINACVGGWKQPQDMRSVNYPWDLTAPMNTFDPWDADNQTYPAFTLECKSGTPAARSEGNLTAMNLAYTSGHVFTGHLNIPLIDLRHYLEPVLDMHHAQQSFATRQRMIEGQGHADNQIIWFAECSNLDLVTLRDQCTFDPTGYALDVLDEWMANIQNNPAGGVPGNKPGAAVDSCFGGDGNLIAAGDDVYDGILNNQPAGDCTETFPIYSTSRIEAGGDIKGDIFKCALKSLDTALADGTYGEVNFLPEKVERLREIFPNGVCDYSQPDVGYPKHWW